jgi:hypothetical protein
MRFGSEFVRDIALAVYRQRLNDSSPHKYRPKDEPRAADRQVIEDGDGGAMQRDRAESYDPVVRHTLAYLHKRGCLTGDAVAAILPPKEKKT